MEELAGKCIDIVIWLEGGNKPDGGFVNRPDDSGGETKFGISKRAHPDVDIPNLTREQAMEIYYREYWVPMRCNDYPAPIALHFFDHGVNAGAGVANRILSQVQEETVGKVGISDYLPLIFSDKRKRFYKELVLRDRRKSPFFLGWINRVDKVQDIALEWRI